MGRLTILLLQSSKRNYFPIFLQPQSPDCQPVGELPQSALWSLIPGLPLGIQSPRWYSLGTESGMGTFLEKVAGGHACEAGKQD